MDEGYLHIIMGPMFSSKTTTLINEINVLKVYKKSIFVINSKKDVRVKTDSIKNHNNQIFMAEKYNELDDILINKIIVNKYDTVIIDEAQFFENLVDFVKKLLDNKIYVIVAGLNGDSNQEKFGYILDLIPLCNKITKLSAICNICNDGTPGDFTKLKSDIKKTNKILIGDCDKYIAVCRKHL